MSCCHTSRLALAPVGANRKNRRVPKTAGLCATPIVPGPGCRVATRPGSRWRRLEPIERTAESREPRDSALPRLSPAPDVLLPRALAAPAPVGAQPPANRKNYFQGKILMGLAELSFSRFMYDLGVLVNTGRWKSQIMNLYYVRRWNLDKLIGYDRAARRKLRDSFRNATVLYKKALEEFSADQYESDGAHVAYALALKHAITFRFTNATK